MATSSPPYSGRTLRGQMQPRSLACTVVEAMQSFPRLDKIGSVLRALIGRVIETLLSYD